MAHSKIGFQVRIKEDTTLNELGRRVGRILDCTFAPSHAKFFEGDAALETRSLGLWIALSGDPEILEGQRRTYILMGTLADDLEADWDDDGDLINISPYILELLTKYDNSAWYIPELEEILSE